MKLTDICRKATTPTAFSTYAVIGVIVTVILTDICARKQCKIDQEKKQPEEMTREDVIEELKQRTATYAPAIGSAMVTAFCIQRAGVLWADYNRIINTSCTDYRDKLARYRTLAPAAAGYKLLQGFNRQQEDKEGEWYCLTGLPDGRDIYFQSTKADVYYAEYHFNRNFQLRGSASVKEFTAFLGIDELYSQHYPDDEDYLGWVADDMLVDGLVPWIDFDHWNTTDPNTGQTINMIGFTWEPKFSEDGEPLAFGYLPSGQPVKCGFLGPKE